MKLRNSKNTIFIISILIASIFLPTFLKLFEEREGSTPIFYPIKQGDSIIENQTIFTQQLIRDPTFGFVGIDSPWIGAKQGDLNDTDYNLSGNNANFKVIGEERQFTYIADPINSSDWTAQQNPEFPAYPEWPWNDPSPSYGIDSFGLWANHSWRETAVQTPSIQWVHNFSIPENMTDYTITSASVQGIINASVDINIDTPADDGEIAGENNQLVSQHVTYDYVEFYIRVADLYQSNIYTIASYKTTTLGQNSPSILTLADTFLEAVSEINMKFYISQVLAVDSHNFTVIIGMDIKCEDNAATDYDYWNMLRIKTFSINFSYTKRIDEFSSVSWSQTGKMINSSLYPGDQIIINNATLDFTYFTNKLWSSSSQNSEIRVYLNHYLHTEVIKLINTSTSPQHVKGGAGFDVSSLLTEVDQNVSIEIELYLADTFELSENITLIIDEVFLNVTYTVIHQETPIATRLEPVNAYSINVPWNSSITIQLNYTELASKTGIPEANFQIDWLGSLSSVNITDDDGGIYSIHFNTTNTYSGQKYYMDITVLGQGLYLSKNLVIEIYIEGRPTLFNVWINGFNVNNTPLISLMYGTKINITSTYQDENTTKSINNSEGLLLSSELNENDYIFTQNLNEYQFILNSSTLGIGVHVLSLYISQDNYQTGFKKIQIEITPRDIQLFLFLNGKNATISPQISVPIQNTLNISFYLFDQNSSEYVESSNYSLAGLSNSSIYTTDKTGFKHEILINTSTMDIGIHYITLIIEKENYNYVSRVIELEITPREADINFSLNNQNWNIMQSDEISIPITGTIEISVNAIDCITNATIEKMNFNLIGISSNAYKQENLENSTTEFQINSTYLGLGAFVISIFAEKPYYEDRVYTFRLIIQPIQTKISTPLANNSITVSPGSSFNLNISIENTDFGGVIENCRVTYSWEFGQGEMQEISPGVYAIDFQEKDSRNIPEGVYPIFITVYNGPDYQFEQFIITVTFIQHDSSGLPTWTGYLFLGTLAILASYLVAYQKYLKYPKIIRKLHSVRKGIRKGKSVNAQFRTRRDLFQTAYINAITPILGIKNSIIEKAITESDKRTKTQLIPPKKNKFVTASDEKNKTRPEQKDSKKTKDIKETKTKETHKPSTTSTPAEVLARIIHSPSTDPEILNELIKSKDVKPIKATNHNENQNDALK
ncbi:hypothetical protein [Candidatus Harpocratesius sp.]